MGDVDTPDAVGDLEVPSEKLQIIRLPFGCGVIHVEGVDGVRSDLTTLQAFNRGVFFVIERREQVNTLYNVAVPKGDAELHLLCLSEMIQLRGGDIVVSWKQSNVNFHSGCLNGWYPINALDMQAVILVLPEMPGVDCRAVLLSPDVMLNIWQGVFDYMQCWDFMNKGNYIDFTLNQTRYAAYEAALLPSLLTLEMFEVGQKRKQPDVSMVDSDDEPSAKKAKV